MSSFSLLDLSFQNFALSHDGRQALPMIWDFAEINPFGNGSGNIRDSLNRSSEAIENCIFNTNNTSSVIRTSATGLPFESASMDAVITDPPYYDNIGYAVM